MSGSSTAERRVGGEERRRGVRLVVERHGPPHVVGRFESDVGHRFLLAGDHPAVGAHRVDRDVRGVRTHDGELREQRELFGLVGEALIVEGRIVAELVAVLRVRWPEDVATRFGD